MLTFLQDLMHKYPAIAQIVNEHVEKYSDSDATTLLTLSTNTLACALLSEQATTFSNNLEKFLAVCIIVRSTVFYRFYYILTWQLSSLKLLNWNT
jgi:hypothetical protein